VQAYKGKAQLPVAFRPSQDEKFTKYEQHGLPSQSLGDCAELAGRSFSVSLSARQCTDPRDQKSTSEQNESRRRSHAKEGESELQKNIGGEDRHGWQLRITFVRRWMRNVSNRQRLMCHPKCADLVVSSHNAANLSVACSFHRDQAFDGSYDEQIK
jgi:hypothetical protein